MNHHLTIHYSVFRSHQHFFFTKLVSILVAKSLLHAPRCPSPLRLSLNVTHPHKGLHTESQGAHEYKVYSQANLHKFKRSQTAMESRVRRAWVWRIWGICTDVSHTDTCKSTHTLSFPPYSLQWEPCIAAFICLSWKKKLKKKNQSGALMAQILRVSPSFFCRLSLPYSIPASCRCLCAAPRLHILTQGLSNGSPFIFLSPHHLLLGLLTSLHCFSSQLSFPAVCLSTASPTASSSSSFLPPLSHFCLPLVPLF